MARQTNPLTDTQINKAKPKDKRYKMFDGRGLILIVAPGGGKWWRFMYRIDGRERSISLGTYPEITLSEARKKREEYRSQVAQGIDPGNVLQATKATSIENAINSLEVVAREWIEKRKNVWTDANTEVVTRLLENYIFPWLGKRPVSDITAPDLLRSLRRMEEKGILNSAERVRGICSQVFRYAIATGRTQRDIAADLRGALATPQKRHFAAITDPIKVASLLRAIDGFEGTFIVKSALQLSPLVFVRPGELRKAEWSEINLDKAEWNIPAEKMKLKLPHLVPLSKQAISILKELQLVTGASQYVFHSTRSVNSPMSDMALSAAIRRMGYAQGEMTPHGFRAMARTILDEVLHVRPDYIEHQLAHAVRDPNGRAYNRTAHIEERRKMMQMWADYLEGLKSI